MLLERACTRIVTHKGTVAHNVDSTLLWARNGFPKSEESQVLDIHRLASLGIKRVFWASYLKLLSVECNVEYRTLPGLRT